MPAPTVAPERRWWHLSATGSVFAAAFFLISMSPSLLPRTWYYQGFIAGLCAAAGYAIGVAVAWVVRRVARAVDLRITVNDSTRHVLRVVVPVSAAIAVVGITTSNVRSQARTAAKVRLDPLTPTDWVFALALAALIMVVLLLAARGIRAATHRLAGAAGQVLPKTIASVLAVVVVAVGVAWVSDSVLFRRTMQFFASAAAKVDAHPPEGRVPPTSKYLSGSPESNEPYDTLGFQGQTWVTSAPSAEQIAAATGRAAVPPIRAYAGHPPGATLEQTAARVVAELERTGAFHRSVIAVFTTTGTGWIDDWSSQAIEYLRNGDTAIAAMQYSYLPSAMSLMTDRETPKEAGKALFDAVRARLLQEPEETRPMLVVGGESLGSYGGQAAFTDANDMLARSDGGVWAGTPRFTGIHSELTSGRTVGSPEIAPVVEDGRHFRFVTRASELVHDYYGRAYGRWEFPRFVYQQHPSDAVVWWDPALLGAEPDWLREPRGRDVNPDVTWMPFVTFWQITTDMAVGHDPPDGYGHRYGAELVNSWGAVLGGEPGADYTAIIAGVSQTVDRTA